MCTVAEALATTRQIALIGKKKFIAVAFYLNDETFVVQVAFIGQDSNVHPFCRALIASLKADKSPTFILSKYTDFANIFSQNLATKLPKHTKINDYAINLRKG